TRIATVSEYTRKDLNQRYKVALSKTDVVYNGANTLFKPLSIPDIQAVRNEFSNGAPYFLFVGLIHPRKNLENQIRAFDAFKTAHKSDYKFLVVGARHWWSAGLTDILNTTKFKDDIIFSGRKDMESLVRIYGAAHALMYVSHFEGFGIPIVEAFHAEIPIITSTTSSMPEICGDAGIFVNPGSSAEISAAMVKITSDEALRKQLIDNGKVLRTKFSWDKTANALWQTIEKAGSADQ